MSKLTPAHLAPFARAFAAAITDGTIPLHDAMSFVETIEGTVLDHRVATKNRPVTPPGKENTSEDHHHD